MGEGRAARKAVGAVRYAAVRYRNAAKTARKRGGTPLKDPAARAGILLSAAAWHPLWLKWRGSLGETHLPDSPVPPAQTRLGEVFQASKRFGFALGQGIPVPHPGRRDSDGGGAAPQEGLHAGALAEDRGCRPGGVIRMPPTDGIPGLRSTPRS